MIGLVLLGVKSQELLEQTQSEAQLKIGQGTWLSQSDTEKTLLGWLSTTRAQLCQAYCAVTVYSEVLEYMVVSNAWSSHIVSTHVHSLFHCQKYERSEAVRLLDFFSLEAAEVQPTQNVTATQRSKPSTQSPSLALGTTCHHVTPQKKYSAIGLCILHLRIHDVKPEHCKRQ